MKKIRVALFLLTICFYSEAQIKFQKRIGGAFNEVSYCVRQTADGGYIITGNSFSFTTGECDVYLVKTDANGNSLWTKSFGGTDFDYGYCVRQTTDGGYIISGSTQSFGAGLSDVYLIKTDANGDTLWTKTFGGTGSDDGNSVQQTTDGGYIIAGSKETSPVVYKVYLIKTDANGDTLWTKTYGGPGDESAYSVQQTTDGGYIISGHTYSFGAGNGDAYLIKTNATGDLLWSKTFGGTGSDYGDCVLQTADGGYIIAGNTYSFGAGSGDVYLIKTNATGDTLWTKTFGGTASDHGRSIQQTADGGYVIAAQTQSFGSDVYLIKTDVSGNLIWTKRFGGIYSDWGSFVQQTIDGGYIITGSSASFGGGDYNFYLIKTDSLGNSGCNEASTATIVNATATQVSSPATIAGSAFFFVTSPATIVGSGGTVTTLCTTVGISPTPAPPQAEEGVAIAPNPSGGNFLIAFPKTINKGIIEIYNVPGEKVYTGKIINSASCTVHCELQPGIYFVKVRDGEKGYVEKLVIQ